MQELSAVDPRPIKVILADAVHLADVTMQDYAQSVIHGDASPAMVDRMLESCRYTAALAKIAIDSGLPLDESEHALVPVDVALSQTVAALMATASDLVDAVLEPGLRSRLCGLVEWARGALRGRLVGGGVLPPLPPRPALTPVVVAAGRREQRSEQPPAGASIVDAEIVNDIPGADPDEDTDEPGDAELRGRGGVASDGGCAVVRRRERERLRAERAELQSLIHLDAASLERDLRLGARLVVDGRVMVERVPAPSRTSSPWARSVTP